MVEGQNGELTAPTEGDANTAAEGHDLVAKTLATFKTAVGRAPHAVHGSNTVRLAKHIFPCHLKVNLLYLSPTGISMQLHLWYIPRIFIEQKMIYH